MQRSFFSPSRRRQRCSVRSLTPSPVLGFALCLAASSLAAPALAQSALSPISDSSADAAAQFHRSPLITQPIDLDQRVTLPGSHPVLPRRAVDLGPATPDTAAPRLLLLLGAQNEPSLQSLLQSQQNPASPAFHRWLTPADFAARFGLVDSDLAAVTAWLQSQGFTIARVSAGRTVLEFSGSVAQLQSAFHVAIHRVSVPGDENLASGQNGNPTGNPDAGERLIAINDPQIPAALAPVIRGFAALGNIPLASAAHRGPSLSFNAETRSFHANPAQPNSAASSSALPGIHPQYTTTSATGNFLALGPSDAATLYDLPNHALNAAFTGTSLDGTGATIAIAATSNIDPTQVANYRSLFGLAANAPTVVLDGATDPGITSTAVQSYLDTEVAGGLAPAARILLYTAADTNVDSGLNLALVRAIDDNLADILVVSASACESSLGTSGNAFYNTLWEQAAAQGISVLVAAGDSGTAACDDPTLETAATGGLAVNGLASTPWNLAIGGTDFAVLAGPDGGGANFPNYVSTTNAPGSLLSVLGYIPEVPWNESSTAYPPATLAQNIALPVPYASILAAGGGASSCSTATLTATQASTCASGYAKPYWQSAPGVPSDGVRDLPDLSLFASTGFDYAAWGICTDQDTDASGNPVPDCQPGTNGQFNLTSTGGTSSATAAIAAILALVRQSTGARLGQPAAVLYNLARTQPSVFHDVTTGNNSVACLAATPNCQSNSLGSDFLTGFNAAAGWDQATGLGSVDAAALVAAWSSVPLASTTTQLTVTPSSVQHGQPVTVTIAVTAGSSTPTSPATPTGSVALHADNANPVFTPEGVAVGAYPLVANGSTGPLTLTSLPGGTYPLTASYGGAASLAGSTSQPVTISITPESSTTLLTWSVTDPATGSVAANSAIHYGSLVQFLAQPYGNASPTVNGTLQPDGAATGTVSFAFGTTPLSTQPLGIGGTAATTPSLLPTGTATVSASYSGDASFNPSTAAAPLTVAPATTTLTLTSSATTYTGSPITFTVQLAADSLGVAPTGSIALRNGSTTLATVPLAGLAASSTSLASGSATLTLNPPPPGANSLTATYSGDANYAASTSPGVLIHGVANFSLTAPPVTVNSIHSTAADTLTLTSLSGYSGTVLLTCKLTGSTTAPNPPQCGLDPASVPLAANATAQPLLLIFGAGTQLPSGVTAGGIAPPGLAFLVALLLLPLCRARRRASLSSISRNTARLLLLALLLATAALPFTACGGSSSLITAGTYSIQVTATDSQNSAITTSATVAVTVQ